MLFRSSAFADRDERYPEVTLEETGTLSPDLVILPSEPYAFADRHVPELQAALTRGDGNPVPVLFVDGRDLFWWGARTPGALNRLSALLSNA